MTKCLKLTLGLILAFAGCRGITWTPCEDTVKSEENSPSGRYIATIFERDCGATTDFSTIVNMRAATEKFDGDRDTIFIVKGQPRMVLVWKDNSTLNINCDDCKTNAIFQRADSWQDVRIAY
jgi:hypothetical protein